MEDAGFEAAKMNHSLCFYSKIALVFGFGIVVQPLFSSRVLAFDAPRPPIMKPTNAEVEPDFPVQPVPTKPVEPAPVAPLEEENDENAPPIVLKLRELTRDLQMPSETDAPFRAFFWAVEDENEDDLTPAIIAQKAKIEATEPIEERNLDEFFEAVATEEEWMDDEQKANASRFAVLRDFLKTELENVKIYAFGERKIEIVVVGQFEDGWAGLLTLVVET